jgi:PKD repeat protein
VRRSIAVALSLAASLVAAPVALAGPAATNKRPDACFTQTPSDPQSGDTVTFSSECSSDEDGSITGREWDLDGDGVVDATGDTASHVWPAPGDYRVRLVVTDDGGATAQQTKTVTIANRSPVAGFSFSPAEPAVGQTVELTSTSADPDGTLASESWDLDYDGVFDDASGPAASFTPTAVGSYPIAIQVVDDRGAATTATKTFVVTQGPSDAGSPGAPQPITPTQAFDDSLSTPAAPPLPVAPAQLRWLDPFPVVRIRGRTTRAGAFVNLFTVRAPGGARIELRCAGGTCPKHRMRKLVRASSGRPSTVRFKQLERVLRAGTRLQVLVTKKGLVGKYTRFRVQRVRPPVRIDRCLMPGSLRPVKCPPAPAS